MKRIAIRFETILADQAMCEAWDAELKAIDPTDEAYNPYRPGWYWREEAQFEEPAGPPRGPFTTQEAAMFDLESRVNPSGDYWNDVEEGTSW